MLTVLLSAAALAFSLEMPAAFGDALLRVRVASIDKQEMQQWLMRRPFAAVLPIQPMLVVPLKAPLCGVELTFRRKPSSEKGGQDGGLRFAISAGDEGESGGDGEGGSDGGGDCGMLLVTRLSEGQYTSKSFSERLLLRRLVADLGSLPAECGEVLSVADLLSGGG